MKTTQVQEIEIELHQIKRLYDGMLREFQRSKAKGETALRDKEMGTTAIQTLKAQVIDLQMS